MFTKAKQFISARDHLIDSLNHMEHGIKTADDPGVNHYNDVSWALDCARHAVSELTSLKSRLEGVPDPVKGEKTS